MAEFDRLIIGGGVIGLAIARAFAKAGDEVLLIDKNDSFGMETSSRNSEVIHAGIYYPSHSLKARLTAKGARDLHSYCESRSIPLARHGKLIVASNEAHSKTLKALKTQGDTNGVLGLELLDKARLQSLEPALNTAQLGSTSIGALYSPETSVVDAHALMAALEADALNHNATIAYGTRFIKARPSKQTEGFAVECATTTPSPSATETTHHPSPTAAETIPHPSPASAETTHFTTRCIINCAGHGSHEVSHNIAGIDPTSIPPHHIAKGQYFTTTRRPPFRHLIYPLPDKGGLGIHLTLDHSGGWRFGPDIRWLAKHEEANYAVNPQDAKLFWHAITRYWADLKREELVPAWAGLRPKTVATADQFQDFIIHHHRHHDCQGMTPGVIALYGMDSPGLTACLTIADYVRNLASN